MRYLVITILLLSGCTRGPVYNTDSADSLGIYLGHSYIVKNGFYKDCTGIATGYSDMDYNDDEVYLANVTCANLMIDFIQVKAKNLKSN